MYCVPMVIFQNFEKRFLRIVHTLCGSLFHAFTWHYYEVPLLCFDDKARDNYFVQHCLLLHWEDIVKSGFRPKQHFIWSNWCGFQFKSKIPFFFVNCYPCLTCGFAFRVCLGRTMEKGFMVGLVQSSRGSLNKSNSM
jgi:hypothetical protein